MPIRQLPPDVVNKIAAGEVIERPASVVKELVENALDAGARRIEIDVRGGGAELIRVTDDGHGIPSQELPLAVASHATSKIRGADDLFHVASLGFRGEALASIAAVSRFTLRSRVAESPAGYELELLGGVPANVPSVARAVAEDNRDSDQQPGSIPAPAMPTAAELAEAVAPRAHPPGTTTEVAELFFNTPVRRKFLKTTSTELGHVTEAMIRLALPHPEVHFTLRHNDRLLHDLPATESWSERIGHFFGEDVAPALIWIESEDGHARLSGYVAHPSQNRPHPRMQYLFLNGRFVKDRSLSHALGEAYRGLLLSGRYPISFLRLDIPPAEVDVNVHPTKLEVRFVDGGRLYRQVLSTLRTRFLASDLSTPLRAPGSPATSSAESQEEHAAAMDGQQAETVQREFVAWAKGEVADLGEPQSRGTDEMPQDEADLLGSRTGESLRLHRLSNPIPPRPGAPRTSRPAAGTPTTPIFTRFDGELRREAGSQPKDALGQHARDEGHASAAADSSQASAALPDDASAVDDAFSSDVSQREPEISPHPRARAMQVHNRYLIAENVDGVVVFDQHALHERILYEQLRAKVLSGAMESQGLLVPEPIDLPPGQAAMVLENSQLFARLGIRVEEFGGDTILVSSYPAMLSNMNIGALVRDVIEEMLTGDEPPDRRDLLDELLHSISCKAAVKAGDRLTPEEIAALLAQGEVTSDSHHCPHGRPTALVLTREMLDRQFLRT